MGLDSRNNKVLWDSRGGGTPKACIMVRNNIQHVCITEFMTRDLVPIRATLGTVK